MYFPLLSEWPEALRKLDIGYTDMLLLHHLASNGMTAYKTTEKAIQDVRCVSRNML